MIDVLTIKDFLDDAMCDELRAQLRLAGSSPAKVYGTNTGGAVDSRMRKAARILGPPETCERIKRLLMERKGAIEQHFKLALGECEEPQFLRYVAGDYFVAHQDGNTPLIHDQTRFRKISVVIFLDKRSDEPAAEMYCGGSLVFHGPYSGPDIRLPAADDPGTLVAFRSETTHEVTPLTHGERHTVVGWFR